MKRVGLSSLRLTARIEDLAAAVDLL